MTPSAHGSSTEEWQPVCRIGRARGRARSDRAGARAGDRDLPDPGRPRLRARQPRPLRQGVGDGARASSASGRACRSSPRPATGTRSTCAAADVWTTTTSRCRRTTSGWSKVWCSSATGSPTRPRRASAHVAIAATPSPAAGQAEPVGGGGRDRHRCADRGAQGRLGLGSPRRRGAAGCRSPGRRRCRSRSRRPGPGVAVSVEQGRPGGAGPGRLRRTEVGAEVAETRPPRAARRRRRGQRRPRRSDPRGPAARRASAGPRGASGRRRRGGGRRCRCRCGGVAARDDHA